MSAENFEDDEDNCCELGQDEFVVERVLDKRIVRKRVEYLIKWKGLEYIYIYKYFWNQL